MVCEALREMLRAARLLRTPVHISHLKAMGPRNWNRRIPEALALLQQARDEGLDVSCDVYPYCAGSTQLLHLLPQDFLAGGTDAVAARLRDPAQRDILRERIAHGRDFDNIAQMVGWDNIRLTTLHRPEFQPLTGKTLAEAARLLGLEPVDCLCHVLAEEACNVTMIDFITCDEDIGRILRAPFASVISDYTITEAGFGADLGAEKFLDIKCRMAGLKPSCVVLVATVRALKYNGGVPKAETGVENLEALEKGLPNLLQHVGNITKVYKLPCVVAINRFPQDTEAELKLVEDKCRELGVNVALSEVWGKGGEGGIALANEVIRLCDQPNDFTFSYELDKPIKEKIRDIVTKIYHGDDVAFTPNAEKQIKALTELGYDKMPICMAKTQYSFSDDPAKLGAPKGFTVTVRNVKVSAGAGFLVALTGEIMTMPGLPKVPAAERIDVDENGKISGLF